jgi:membrane fusion protein (multidrug efflux system)
MPVKAVAAKAAPAVQEASAVGSLRADESVMIRPEIAGRLDKIQFDEGTRVQKGALLAAIDSAELRAVVASSRAQAALDKQRLERAADLQKRGFFSAQALDEARSNYTRSSAKLREDEARLAKTEIRAPFTGVAGLRQVSEGAFVAAGTDIARFEKIDQLKLDFRIPEVFLGQLRAGAPVSAQVDAYAAEAFKGQIYAIEPAVDEQTRTVLVRARIANTDLKLRPGMFARVQITLGVRENAVWVPEEAIVPRGQDRFVFRVVDGKADMVRVTTGARKPGEVEIVKGVASGELVITEGTQRIGPGSPVNVMTPEKTEVNLSGKKG